jgi:uroporphyrinogen decarboxylase
MMTSIERVGNTLNLKPVDQIAVVINPWGVTLNRWESEGHIHPDKEDVGEHFGVEILRAGALNSVANLDHKDVILEETEETKLVLDGNAAKLRRHKLHDSTPEHVDFAVKDRVGFEEHIKPLITTVDRRRIPFEGYRQARNFCAEKKRFFCWSGCGPFEQMHPVCGHEYMLMGMALDPEWVQEMAMIYARMTINHLEILFAEEGRPDGMWFWEDMGYKFKPFMSPQMYKEIIQPAHKLLFDYSHSLGCKVIVHSCGFVEPLVPGLIEAGMNCLQAMEVKAGMDMPRLFEKFGDKISFFGGIDSRAMISNDREQINAELMRNIPPVVGKGGSYILHSDHSEPPEIEYETMWYFIRRGIEIAADCMRRLN